MQGCFLSFPKHPVSSCWGVMNSLDTLRGTGEGARGRPVREAVRVGSRWIQIDSGVGGVCACGIG
jgi:hypothetical protein